MCEIEEYISYKNIINKLDINEGDTLLIGSDIVQLIMKSAKNGEKFDADCFIGSIQKKIGHEGTILIPTYSWDFCEGKVFDYNKSKARTGALANKALKREDFVRTKHPIYSFAVWGKDQIKLYNMNNKESFGKDSPFEYLYKQKAKMLMIDVDYQNSFTFVHYVEKSEKADYRYDKNFISMYVDENGEQTQKEYSMHVRDLDKEVITRINPIGEKIKQKKASIHKLINGIEFVLVDLNESYEIIKYDIKNNEGRNLHLER